MAQAHRVHREKMCYLRHKFAVSFQKTCRSNRLTFPLPSSSGDYDATGRRGKGHEVGSKYLRHKFFCLAGADGVSGQRALAEGKRAEHRTSNAQLSTSKFWSQR